MNIKKCDICGRPISDEGTSFKFQKKFSLKALVQEGYGKVWEKWDICGPCIMKIQEKTIDEDMLI